MKKIITLLVFFMGAITLSASAQYAADRAKAENTFGFGPRLGFYTAGDADDGNFFGGLQARAKFGAIVGLEGSIEYRASQEFALDDEVTANASSVPITASFMLFAPLSEFVAPYGLVGAGAYYTFYTYDGADDVVFDDNDRFELGYHLGVGAELWFTDKTALSLDYRYLYLDPDDDVEGFDDFTFDGNVFTASLMFYF